MPPESTGQVVIACDLDSTLCDTKHREYLAPSGEYRESTYSWVDYSLACRDDGLIEGVARALNLFYELGYQIHFVSGRNEEARGATVDWLQRHGVKFHALRLHDHTDVRHNAQYKVGYLKSLQARGYDVRLMFEDHISVCELIEKETSIPCITVKPRYEDHVGVSFNAAEADLLETER